MNTNRCFYHYFEKETGPFVSLSDASDEDAQKIIADLINEDKTLAAKTHGGQYMFYRRLIENRARLMFIEKGGKPVKQTPHYMVWGESHHLQSWYIFKNCPGTKTPHIGSQHMLRRKCGAICLLRNIKSFTAQKDKSKD